MDRTSVVFSNKQPKKVIKKAERKKNKYLKRFGDDRGRDYKLALEPIPALDGLGVNNVVFSQENAAFPENALIVGNIRMGFGHYRISIAMASCARALGYQPIWLDLASFDATGSKMIREQNRLYSLASRISQKSKLFNRLIWEPMNSEGFRKISYNACDQKNSELLTPIFENIPKDIPYIATHVWCSQGAIHAGMKRVVNAVPDNWPMGLHLSEGAVHAVQTPFAYLGYKMLNGFDKKPLSFLDERDLKMVGGYVDHELVYHLREDNERRIDRMKRGAPYRILLTVGGAGAGQRQFLEIVRHLMPRVERGEATLFLNLGDHRDVFDYLCKKVVGFRTCRQLSFEELKCCRTGVFQGDVGGIYTFCSENIFEAVYSTNLLMREADLLLTKPSELSFYPVPKLFMRHIGGHEVYGARYSSQIGDGTNECAETKELLEMLNYLLADRQQTAHMCERINVLKEQGYYNGGYECVRLAARTPQ